MIKSALQYVLSLNKPEIVEIGGHYYTDRNLGEVQPYTYYPKGLTLTTLNSLVDYLAENKDEIPLISTMLHISDYDTVTLITRLDEYQKRSEYITAKANVPGFDFGRFMDKETFMIGLQSKFCDTGDKGSLLKILGNIVADEVTTYGDDGVTQGVTTKKGVALGTTEAIPNPVKLAPHRTFVEINQPVSEFILRIKKGHQGELSIGLFEADGGAWKLEAIARSKAYLEGKLKARNIHVSILA